MWLSRIQVTAALAAASFPAVAQPAPAPPPGYVRVDAPLAERLVRRAMAAHPVLRKLGLHATPDGTGVNVIIASDAPAKIGKPSSPADMAHLAAGGPFVTRLDKEGVFDLLLPIADRAGGDLGHAFVVMEVPVGAVADEAAALAVGRDVRDDLQRAIPGKAALYGP